MSVSHRKSKNIIKLVDKNGNPVKNKTVEFKLINHEFLFGSGAFDFVPYCSDLKPDAIAFYTDKQEIDKEFYHDRITKWLNMFNYGTLPFYWAGYEPVEGDVQFESRMNAAKFLKDKGITLKGHPLCWHTECCKWLMDYDNKTILDKQLQRIDRDVTNFKGVIDMWDVINETVIMPIYDRYDNAITRICNEYGRINLIKEVFDVANKANPNATLLINDFNLSDDYRKVIDECLEKGVPITAIGLQSHQHQGYKGLKFFEDVIRRFSVFGLPLHFTENTLVSGDIMPAHIVDLNDYQVESWPTNKIGEERQSSEWQEMYHMAFESPLVEAITGWDFADGAWLHAPSGIVREDNSIKPSYEALHELVHKKWSTVGTATTNDSGLVEIEGFRGTYELKIDGTNLVYKLTKNDIDLPKVIVI